jgi:hypothetical protein
MGDTNIQLQKQYFTPTQKGIYFINLHSNETTSITAAQAYLKETGGSLLQLVHGEVRYVQFNIANQHYKIDPNRIFTTAGIKATLSKNSTYTKAGFDESKKLADSILAQMQQPKLIVAMHNNTNGDFSIISYTKGKAEAANAAAIYINPKMDADDFVHTTEKAIFNHLKNQQINVVLQKAQGFVDDGSLSVYCGQKKIPYINIEAEEGHKEVQLSLLNALTSIIASYGNK